MKRLGLLGWLIALLLAWFVAFVVTSMVLGEGLAWALGWLAIVWAVFLLAESLRWVPLRDLAWAASVGWGFGLIRWLDPMIDGAAGAWRWLLMAADLLCLAVCVLVAPALLSGLARRLRPPEPPPLPVERPAAHPRQWGPKDEA